jgi:hypothetical protein
MKDDRGPFKGKTTGDGRRRTGDRRPSECFNTPHLRADIQLDLREAGSYRISGLGRLSDCCEDRSSFAGFFEQSPLLSHVSMIDIAEQMNPPRFKEQGHEERSVVLCHLTLYSK